MLADLALIEQCVQFERVNRATVCSSGWEQSSDNRASFAFKEESGARYCPVPLADLPECMNLLQRNEYLMEHKLNLLNVQTAFNDPDPTPVEFADALQDGKQLPHNRWLQSSETALKQRWMDEQAVLISRLDRKRLFLELPVEVRSVRKVRRLLLPIDEYPDYNFMSMLIGPSGCNHKRLEMETGAQISIRGRGGLKEVRVCEQQSQLEAQMPLHVHVTGDSQEIVDRAVKLIEPLIDPAHPCHEQYRRRILQHMDVATKQDDLAEVQLNELATNKTNAICDICGGRQHYSFECPSVVPSSFARVEISCGFCGEKGHLITDCLQARERGLSEKEISQLVKKQFEESNVELHEEDKLEQEFYTVHRR